MYKLVISDDEGKTTVVPLVHDEVTIGRDEDNTIRLTERNVSRRHAKLLQQNGGGYLVSDLSSYNGVRLNGVRIAGTSKLRPGDQMMIGDYLVAIHVAASDSITAPGSAGLGFDETDPSFGMEHTESVETELVKAPVSTSRPARLVMISPPSPGAEYALGETRTQIGRAEDLDLWVNHKSISRHHAEIVKVGDGFRIADTHSSNGVRVNDRLVRDEPLREGDVIELGEILFRFVPEGSDYVFSNDDAVRGGGRRSRVPLIAMMAIVALGAAVGVTVMSRKGPPPAEVAAPQPAKAVEPELSLTEVESAVARCQTLLDDNQFRAAVASVEPVLSAFPGHVGASECRDRAENQLRDVERFGTGRLALAEGNVDAAYQAFSEISPASPLLDSDEVAEAAKRYAEHHIDAARRAQREGNGEVAEDHAQRVLDMSDVTPEWQRAAERVLGGEVRAQAAMRPARKPGRPGRPREPVARSEDPPKPKDSGSSGLSPMEQCLAEGGDVNPCLVRKLANARNPRDLQQLIETYRVLRDTPNMIKHMKRFIALHPDHRKSDTYRQVLLSHGGP
ncbi:MAG: FHA domain-containing protein [Myxococcales bacterium]|nr:FHA domain-containing protein [Myxococcales bacterium]